MLWNRKEWLFFGSHPLEMRNSQGQTPIHVATNNGDIESIKLFLGFSENPKNNANRLSTGLISPLMIAAFHSHLRIIDLLCTAGAKIDALDYSGNTVLHYAAHKNDPWVIDYLLQKGIDTSIKNKNNETALEIAKRLDNNLVIKKLEIKTENREAGHAKRRQRIA